MKNIKCDKIDSYTMYKYSIFPFLFNFMVQSVTFFLFIIIETKSNI